MFKEWKTQHFKEAILLKLSYIDFNKSLINVPAGFFLLELIR